jgi:hypothetical protein
MRKEYQKCTRCVMDTSSIDITFSTEGVCNYCTEFLARYRPMQEKGAIQKKAELEAFINVIKTTGKGKRYDCIIGL